MDNKWYKGIKGVRVPGYLKKGWGESRWRSVARFRLRNEIKERESRKKRKRGDVDYATGGENRRSMCGKIAGNGKMERVVGKRR